MDDNVKMADMAEMADFSLLSVTRPSLLSATPGRSIVWLGPTSRPRASAGLRLTLFRSHEPMASRSRRWLCTRPTAIIRCVSASDPLDLPTASALVRLRLLTEDAWRRVDDTSEAGRHLALIALDGA